MSLPPGNLLTDIALIIAIATILAYIARFLRQPIVAAYVIAGIFLGPIGAKLLSNISWLSGFFVTDLNAIGAISEIGIMFLLFIVGLQINLTQLKNIGPVAIVGGTVQIILTFIVGFLVTSAIGFTTINSIYAGLIIAFSSTMIVIKLLSDKEELNSLHGRIMIGILLMQDALVILPLSFLALPKLSPGVVSNLVPLGIILLKIGLIILIAGFLRKFLIKGLFRYAAKSTELLLLLSLSFCFFFAFIANKLGFSYAIGAFIGGVTLASLPYYLNILGEVKPLKDFFSTIFFVSLGMQVSTLSFGTTITPLAILLLLTILIKPLIFIIILSMFGYNKRTTFVSAFALGQISEFSLIFITQAKGIISQELFSLTIIVAAISITLTAYFMAYYEQLYKLLNKPLSIFEKLSLVKREIYPEKTRDHYPVICFGCHRMGNIIVSSLIKSRKKVLIVDLNPDIVEKLRSKKLPCIYGDISNFEILKQIDKKKTKLVISTVPHEEENTILLKYLKKLNPKITVFVTANHLHEAIKFYEMGADYVIIPHVTAGEKIATFLAKGIPDRKSLRDERTKHLKALFSMN